MGIIFLVSLVYAQEESPISEDLEEIPAPYPEGEQYITPPPDFIQPGETPVYKTSPDSEETLEVVTLTPEELMERDYREVILVNKSERETYAPNTYEVVRPDLTTPKENSSLTKIIAIIIIIGIIAWLVIKKFRK